MKKAEVEQAIKTLNFIAKCKANGQVFNLNNLPDLEIQAVAITGYHPLSLDNRINEGEAINRLHYLLEHPTDYEGVSPSTFPRNYWNDVYDATGSIWID